MKPLDHELLKERGHHETCRAALARMTADVEEQVVVGEDTAASGADAEALGRHLRSRAKVFREQPPGPLFFGRLDREDGQVHHIGRRRVAEHPAAPPLVVDWRAPVSRAYYQAGPQDPQGVVRRRRFGWAANSLGASEDLTALEDERLTAGDPGDPGGSGGSGGSGVSGGSGASGAGGTGAGAILTGEIERPRVGPMRDIAATLQPEQDDLVRSGPADSICVQGAPGTGKTAVGLHRAAYLLYTHPQRLRRSGLLVLGPNRAFLSYIAEVLPALGETGVRQSTVGEELARHEVRAEDDEAAARVKHDARMAEVLRRALYARVDPESAGDLSVPDGSYHWRLPAAEIAGIVTAVREEAPPYATGRERVRARTVRALQLRAERRAGPLGAAWTRRIERARPLSAHVDACWPKVTPEEVLAAFLTEPSTAGAPSLTDAERDAVRWAKPPRSYRSARWSAADLVLLDELAGLIERPEGYAHIVVDEAQDLSPMECRAVARRADFGSLTVLGDLAQGTTPWAARDWRAQLVHLGKPDAEVVPLTTGYRVPAAVVDLANRLLPDLDADVPPGRSLRGGGTVTVRRVTDLGSGVAEAVRAALEEEGSVAVIAPDELVGELREYGAGDAAGNGDGSAAAQGPVPGAAPGSAVPGSAAPGSAPGSVPEAAVGSGSGAGSGFASGFGGRVSLVPASLAKGLEFDHVVVAEPAAIVAAEPRGLHRLYVVLTRAVSRLDLVHREPLPEQLGRGGR
ncbi:HelD family protein [Streptomyces showdoensis]|uniref:ATPase AAA n=1 Tax=Streptomyces showdoensis TaxID=68268 RepID=A0A2P2GMM5_STREW|nr:AAA family ATPase [Streptomyces showdoensis]KKZ72756.1 ATPase AAA [Streptomyces showdoensis]